MAANYNTREEWLMAFVSAARPIFTSIGAPLPANIRASIGYPTTGHRSNTIGQCIPPSWSSDGSWEIFINPKVKLDGNGARLADILTHELAHTVAHDGHGPDFKRVAVALGLSGKMTATVAGPGWYKWAEPVLMALGPIPYAEITSNGPAKKKKTFAHKIECPDCGWLARVAAAHVNAHSHLSCPVPDCDAELIIHPLKA